MTDQPYEIQELVNASGVPRRNIYFYVQQGILPPPQGAGLAARYSEDHLLRLRLIPVLRSQGLRLDEIRERFGQMSADEMRTMLQAGAQPTSPRPPVGKLMQLPGEPQFGRGGARFTHFNLPAGLVLMAPDDLLPADRQRLHLLLQAAQQIFSGAVPGFMPMDALSPDDDPAEPGNGNDPAQ